MAQQAQVSRQEPVAAEHRKLRLISRYPEYHLVVRPRIKKLVELSDGRMKEQVSQIGTHISFRKFVADVFSDGTPITTEHHELLRGKDGYGSDFVFLEDWTKDYKGSNPEAKKAAKGFARRVREGMRLARSLWAGTGEQREAAANDYLDEIFKTD